MIPRYTSHELLIDFIPRLGFGTALIPVSELPQLLQVASSQGIRLVDTAEGYGNEAEIGRAIRASGVPRNEYWIVSKTNASPRQAIQATLRRLNTTYVDVYLLHWPQENIKLRAFYWHEMQWIKERGLARFVGCANHTLHHLLGMRNVDVIQVEFNPTVYQAEMLEYCRKNDLCMMGYGILAGSIYSREIRGVTGSKSVVEHPCVHRIAASLHCSPAQVLISWGLAHGVVQIPKSNNPIRVCQNAASAQVALTEAHVSLLDNLRDCNLGTDATLHALQRQGRASIYFHLSLMLFRSLLQSLGNAIRCKSILFSIIRCLLYSGGFTSCWCKARSVMIESFFVDDHPRLISLLRHESPIELDHDVENSKSAKHVSVLPLDLVEAIRSIDPNISIDADCGESLMELLKCPANAKQLDSVIRNALVGAGMKHLEQYVMWDIRVVTFPPGVCLIHWDRQYRYAAAPGAFQLWAPIYVSDINQAGLLIADNIDELVGRHPDPIDLRLDESSVVVQDHLSRRELERHRIAEFKCRLRPARVPVGQALVFNMRCVHAADLFETHKRIAVTFRYIPRKNFTRFESHFPTASEDLYRCGNYKSCLSAARLANGDGVIRYTLREPNYSHLDNSTAYRIVPCWNSL
ncbi:aldo/keto reductase [bacterium]|nr:aldo/keto reductase [bacterium]